MKLRRTQLSIPARDTWLSARLSHAPDVRGLILIVQSFTEPCLHEPEAAVAAALQHAHYATLTLDLTQNEPPGTDICYDIARLSERTLATVEWIRYQPGLTELPLGILALGTGAAAAIRAAAQAPERIGALCILSGRPDLAGASPLRAIKAPACFIVGQDDPRIDILLQAGKLIPTQCEWLETPGSHPEQMSADMLADSATLAAAWIQTHMPARTEERTALFSSLASALSYASVPSTPPPEQ